MDDANFDAFSLICTIITIVVLMGVFGKKK